MRSVYVFAMELDNWSTKHPSRVPAIQKPRRRNWPQLQARVKELVVKAMIGVLFFFLLSFLSSLALCLSVYPSVCLT